MKHLNLTAVVVLYISSFVATFSSVTYSQNLDDVLMLCDKATAANKAMARQAGYDLDAICSDIEFSDQEKKATPAPLRVARQTIASETEEQSIEEVAEVVAPVAIVGVGETKAVKDLKPFGYDLFANAPTTFAPAASIPVSADYLLGPGDTLDILFYGKSNRKFSLEINREGFVDFPELGPVGLAGLTYGEAKDMLRGRIAAQIIGTQVSISMGSLRSMQIFVLGEAFKPGAYTVSSLSTITHALVSSGGVNDIGSLRNIQLKRKGNVIAELDLYDLLMKGDTRNDIRVQASDVIFIPTVGSLVSVSGQVLRPAIYELKGGERVEDLIELAGGLSEKAFAGSARIERIGEDGFMTALDLNLNTISSRNNLIKGGDHLTVDGIIDRQKNSVNLIGHINYPGIFAFREDMRLSDLVKSLDQFPQGLDLDFGMISREDPLTGFLSAVSFSPIDVLQTPGSKGDVLLHSRDRVMFFSDTSSRESQLSELIEALKNQARAGESEKIVSISGSRLPGRFPLIKDMRISDLIENGGGLQANYADLDYALLVREEIKDEGDIKVFGIELRAALENYQDARNFILLPKDELILFSKNENKSIRLQNVVEKLKSQTKLAELARIVRSGGSVKFPGEYPLTEGMDVENLIVLSGGLIASAYSQAAEISRFSLQNPERAESTILVSNLNSEKSLELEPSDYVEFRTIPEYTASQTITLEGEFVFPGTYAFEKGEMLSSVIERAGGFTEAAYVDGSVFLRESLREREQEEIERLFDYLNDEIASAGIVDIAVDPIGGERLAAQQAALISLSNAVATGRLVIPLSDILNGQADDVLLKDSDRLLIPKMSQEVTIIGEVRRPTSYLYDPAFSQSNYIEQSGGFKERAYKKNVYVVKAGGQVIMPKKGLFSLFRFKSAREKIEPGDTIVVPLDSRDVVLRGIPLFSEISEIIFQLSLGAAAINSFNNSNNN